MKVELPTRQRVEDLLERTQAEIARQDVTNERAVWTTPEELATLIRAVESTDALRLRWFELYVTYHRHKEKLEE